MSSCAIILAPVKRGLMSLVKLCQIFQRVFSMDHS